MANTFYAEAFLLLGVSICMVLARSILRVLELGFRNLELDDYLMVLAITVYSFETAAAYWVGSRWHGLANSAMTDLQRISLQPESTEWVLRVNGSKTQLVGWCLYTLLLWLLKASLCVLYRRLTQGLWFLTTQVRITYAIVAGTYISTIASILGACRPFHRNWQINPNPGNTCQPAISRVNLLITLACNILSDAVLFTIPVRVVWTSQISRQKKWFVTLLFAGGVFVVVAGIVRCVIVIQDPVNGAAAAGSWAVRETFVALVVTNVPVIYPAVRRIFSRRFGTRHAPQTSLDVPRYAKDVTSAGAHARVYRSETYALSESTETIINNTTQRSAESPVHVEV